MADLNIAVKIAGQETATGPIGKVTSALGSLSMSVSAPIRGLGQLGGVLQTALGTAMGGAITAGAGMIQNAIGGIVGGGFDLNSSIETVRAQLFAFTKDGGMTSQILNDIRTEAAKTPFEFMNMARATASLLPASKTSGVALMDLIKQAEILAASNPAEGLEGAAFSLKEALSGDFTSIIERFNLPRQRLKELKEQGVPAMQAVSMAMQEMGLDADLVTGMATTWSGRLSSLNDYFDTLKASFMEPVFDMFKGGLEGLQPLLDANSERFNALAKGAGTGIANAFRMVGDVVLPKVQAGFGLVKDAVTTFQQAWNGEWVDSEVILPFHRVVGIVGTVARVAIPALIEIWGRFASGFADGGLIGGMLGVFNLFRDMAPELRPVFDVLSIGLQTVQRVAGELAQGDLGGAFNALANGVTNAWAAVGRLGEWLRPIMEQVGVQLWEQVQGWGAALWGWVEPQIAAAQAKLEPLALAVWAWIQAKAAELPGQFTTWANGLVAWIQPMIPPFLAQMEGLALQLWAWIQAQAAPIGAQFSAWGSAFVAWIVPATVDFLGRWPGMLRQFLDWIEVNAGPILAQLATWAGAFIGWIAPMIPPFLVGLAGVAAAIVVWIGETVGVIAERLPQWQKAMTDWVVEKLAPGFKAALDDWGKGISKWFQDGVSWLGEEAGKLGKGLVDGIVTALKNGADAIKSTLKGIIDQAIAEAKAFFGIQSPSRVTAQKIGLPLAQGLAVGMRNGIPGVLAAQRDLSGAAYMNLPTGGYTLSSGYTRGTGSAGSMRGGIVIDASVHIAKVDSRAELEDALAEHRRDLEQRIVRANGGF